MNWPTELPASNPVANVHRSQKHPEYCTNLLARIGTVGWSAVVSYGESAWTELELGAKPEPGSPLGALQGMGLIGFEQLPAGSARTVSVLYLTKAGRRQLMAAGLPPVHTEFERLRDRWGTQAAEHHGQVILFAALARRFGYRAQVGVAVPGQRLFADVRLTQDDGTEAWCLVESGTHQDSHPLDRWHRLGRCQPFLPLVAPDRQTMNRLREQAQPNIYKVYLTNLDELVGNVGNGHHRLWLADVNRFRDADRGCNRVVPGLRHRLACRFQGHVRARTVRHPQHSCKRAAETGSGCATSFTSAT